VIEHINYGLEFRFLALCKPRNSWNYLSTLD